MLMIRLKRIGKLKQAFYRLIVSEKTKDTQAEYVEDLGIYNPHAKDNLVKVNNERALYWIKNGAQLSTTVNNLFITAGIIKGDKKRMIFISKGRQAKMTEKKAAAEKAAAPAA